MLDGIWEKLVGPFKRMLVRPYRQYYSIQELGPTRLRIHQQQYVRQDFEVLNDEGLKVVGSHFKKVEGTSGACLIYLHANSSSRLSGLKLLKFMKLGLDFCVFDFSGCGRSQGDFITLGVKESKDIKSVVKWLRRQKVHNIVLWGRSMGAVSAIEFSQTDPDLSCIVLDSPFSDLQLLMHELAASIVKLPQFLSGVVIDRLAQLTLASHKFDIKQHKPILKIQKITTPVLLITGTEDTLVHCSHTHKLFDKCRSKKQLIQLGGGHNDTRGPETLMKVASFICKYADLPAPQPQFLQSSVQFYYS